MPENNAAEIRRELANSDRLVELIVDGKHPFPVDLFGTDRERLAAAVRGRLRERLVQLIAKAIAADLHRERQRI
jgi:hypothetical protein